MISFRTFNTLVPIHDHVWVIIVFHGFWLPHPGKKSSNQNLSLCPAVHLPSPKILAKLHRKKDNFYTVPFPTFYDLLSFSSPTNAPLWAPSLGGLRSHPHASPPLSRSLSIGLWSLPPSLMLRWGTRNLPQKPKEERRGDSYGLLPTYIKRHTIILPSQPLPCHSHARQPQGPSLPPFCSLSLPQKKRHPAYVFIRLKISRTISTFDLELKMTTAPPRGGHTNEPWASFSNALFQESNVGLRAPDWFASSLNPHRWGYMR